MKKQINELFAKLSEIEEINLIIYNPTTDEFNNDILNITIVCSELDILAIDYETLAITLEEIKKVSKANNMEFAYTVTTEKELMKREKTLEERKEFYKMLSECTIVYSNSTKLRNLINVRKRMKR